MRVEWNTKLILTSLALGVLTSYIVALGICRVSSARLYDYPTELQPPPAVVWSDPASPGTPTGSPDYWLCRTMRGFGRRIEVGIQTPGVLVEDASKPGWGKFSTANSKGELSDFGQVRIADEPPPAVDAIRLLADQPVLAAGTRAQSTVSSAGWPMLCTRGWRIGSGFGEKQAGLWGPSLADARSENDWVPLLPLPLGLVVNALFFGVPWFALLTVARATVRRRRRKRGLCSACGYPMNDLKQCPECGNPLQE